MKRITFALAVPVLLAALGVVVFANLVTAGFSGEGCRFPYNADVRWNAGMEWLLVQSLFAVPFAGLQSRLPG